MEYRMTLSGIPMVGYRNWDRIVGKEHNDFIRHSDGGVSEPHQAAPGWCRDFIRHSDGGVSEQAIRAPWRARRLYQAFRWWGIGTDW